MHGGVVSKCTLRVTACWREGAGVVRTHLVAFDAFALSTFEGALTCVNDRSPSPLAQLERASLQ